jgi:hypothetical protein
MILKNYIRHRENSGERIAGQEKITVITKFPDKPEDN